MIYQPDIRDEDQIELDEISFVNKLNAIVVEQFKKGKIKFEVAYAFILEVIVFIRVKTKEDVYGKYR